MKLVYFTFLPIIFLLSINLFGQNTFRTTSTSVIGYLEYVPKDYSQNSDKYPIVIFLHGIGERGVNSVDVDAIKQDIGLVERNGPPKFVKAGTQFPFILISPQLKSNYGGWPAAYIMEVLEYCRTYLRIDERRIYITGLSLGGSGTWGMTQTYPKLFAAIAPVCGGQNSLAKACTLSAENLPVWGFHGDADTTIPMTRTVNMINAINNCLPAPNPLAKLTIYPGVGHNAWDYAYRNDHSLHNPNIYEWLMSYTNTINGTNKIPVANAGLDIIKALPIATITLQSTSTDADGKITAVAWKQLSGPSTVTFSNTTVASPQISNLVEGVYTFQLKVTDNAGDVDSDYIRVTIVPSQTTVDMPPVVSVGNDRVIKLPSASNTLIGSAYDPDGKIISYRWVQVSGAACTLSSNSVSRPKVSNLASGNYVFRMTAFDNNGVSTSDDITITGDLPPTVFAGIDVKLTLPVNSVTLKGSATDKDGKIVSYGWSFYSGPAAVVLTNKSTPSVTVTKLEEGTYVFRLTVKDDLGIAGIDDVTVTVLPAINGRDTTPTNSVSASESKFMLTDSTNPDLVNSTIEVYNQYGQKYYEGAWTVDAFSSVFNKQGFYIFSLKTAKGLVRGKVYVTQDN